MYFYVRTNHCFLGKGESFSAASGIQYQLSVSENIHSAHGQLPDFEIIFLIPAKENKEKLLNVMITFFHLFLFVKNKDCTE